MKGGQISVTSYTNGPKIIVSINFRKKVLRKRGAYNRTYSLALRQAKFYFLKQPSEFVNFGCLSPSGGRVPESMRGDTPREFGLRGVGCRNPQGGSPSCTLATEGRVPEYKTTGIHEGVGCRNPPLMDSGRRRKKIKCSKKGMIIPSLKSVLDYAAN